MGILNSRFSFNSTGGQFHSSGLTDGQSVTGNSSAQSFEQRQRINKNRQTISRYQDASVVSGYRKDALVTGDTVEDQGKVGSHRNSRVDNRKTSRVGFRPSSKIDVVKSSRQGFNAGQIVPERTNTPPRFGLSRPTFSEPQSRTYDPYR